MNRIKTKYLIIGNSVSGVNCIEGIRQVDRVGKITVISDEDVYNYSRPLISYYLGGRLGEEDLNFKDRDFYDRNEVDLLTGTKAERIDKSGKAVFTDKGIIEFDRMLISTGGKPFIPDLKGCSADMEGIFTFTKLDDARRILGYIEENSIKEAVVLGGGLIGLKCTEGLIERGIKVHIVELADRLLSTTMDRKSSDVIERVLRERKNCEVFKQDAVEEIETSADRPSGVRLRSGRTISTKLVILAVGVRPNLALVRNTGIVCNRGISVDNRMQTNLEGIYAAGDVAEGMDSLLEKNAVIAIWPVAARQGRIAGINMAGGEGVYRGMFPMNAVDIAGVPVISFGITNPPDNPKFEVLQKEGDGFYRKIVLKNNIIVGCIFLGKIERSGIFSGIIREKMDVSQFKEELLSDDFGLLVLPKEYRKHMVTGEGIEV
jgi:NAD(P)H-nitrite reductase large subunit